MSMIAFAAALAIWPGSVEKPPEQYMSGPVDGVVEEHTWEDISRICTEEFGKPERGFFQGCYIPQSKRIIVPIQNGDRVRAALLIHEVSHARGWRHESKDW